MTAVRVARMAALAGLLAASLALAPVARAADTEPPSTVTSSTPGGHLLLGRHRDRVAASNQGTIDCEAGAQFVAGKGALWGRCFTDARETGVRFSRLHIQELDARHRVTQQYTALAARGPTHRSGSGRIVYYRGRFRPVHANTVSFRVGFSVEAWKAGTFLKTSRPKCVASYETELSHGYIVRMPLC